MRKGTQTVSQPSDNFARFTNRVDELARFQQALETPLEAPLPMLFFYGVAGAGKSWLKRRMIESLDQSNVVPRASIDFDSQQGNPFKDDLRATLHEIVRQLDIVCPRFEMAFYVFNLKMGQLAANPASPDSNSDSAAEDWGEAALTDLLGEVLHEIPGAGVVAKAYLFLARRLSEPERQKTFREWLKSESGRDDATWLESASPQDINQDLCRRLGLDLLLQLPRRQNRACRAVIFLDTWEHMRRGKATGLQHYTDSEKWVVDLYGAAHSINALNEVFPFLQIVLFGRDHATWPDYDPDCGGQNVLEQHLVGGLSESDARNFLEKSQITDPPLQSSILKTSADTPSRTGVVGYHAYHLGLCVDTVYAERQQGIVSTPESFDLSPDKKFALTDRFLQSLDEAGRRRVTRLSLTPRFDDAALHMICKAGNEDDTSVLCDDIKSYTFVQPAGQTAWFVLHPLMKSSLRDRAEAEGKDKLRDSHETWRQYWTSRAADAPGKIAGLAWFHQWQLDPQAALVDWVRLTANARSALNYVAHRQLIDWWDSLAIEQKKGLTPIEADALDCLGTELIRASLGLPRENLARAVKAYRSALEVRTRQLSPHDWGVSQNNLGAALCDQGIRFGREEGPQLLSEAINAYRAALEVRTREQSPADWALTQNNLGLALSGQAIRTAGNEASRLLGDAIAAYRAALEVRTHEQVPRDWALTQNNLGLALWMQGLRSSGSEASHLLADAIAAYRAALKVRTREQSAEDWALTQQNLGSALSDQGVRTTGQDGLRLLDEAVAACRTALEVRTREQLPQDWALTQINLGMALWRQGVRAAGPDSTRLLGEAVTAYRSGLEISTHEQLPQQWAMTQNNLGLVLWEQGVRVAGPEATRLLGEAVTAYRSALEVWTRDQFPQDWALAQQNLATALSDQGIRTDGAESFRLLGEAVAAYRSALEVRTREQLPQDWALTQNNLGLALWRQASGATGEEALRLLSDAVTACRAALEVRTREQLPQDWALTQNNLGFVLNEQAGRMISADDPKARELLNDAIAAYQAALQVFTEESAPRYTALVQKNLKAANDTLHNLPLN